MITWTIEAEDLAGLAFEVNRLHAQLSGMGLMVAAEPGRPDGPPKLEVVSNVQPTYVSTMLGNAIEPEVEPTTERPKATFAELTQLLRKIVKVEGFETGTAALAACGVSQLKDIKEDGFEASRAVFEGYLGQKESVA